MKFTSPIVSIVARLCGLWLFVAGAAFGQPVSRGGAGSSTSGSTALSWAVLPKTFTNTFSITNGTDRTYWPTPNVKVTIRTLASPRPAVVYIAEVDLTNNTLVYVTPPSAGNGGPTNDVTKAYVKDFLKTNSATVGLDVMLYNYVDANPTANDVGFSASRGTIVSPFTTQPTDASVTNYPNQSYAIVDNAPAINFDPNNLASVVTRGVDARHIAQTNTLWNAVAGSALVLSNGNVTLPDYSGPPGNLTTNGTYSNGNSWYNLNNTARSVLAINQAGTKLYLFCSDAVTGTTLTLNELLTLVVQDTAVLFPIAGNKPYYAINCDGGGSVDFAWQNPFTQVFEALNPTAINAPRLNATSIAIGYNGRVFPTNGEIFFGPGNAVMEQTASGAVSVGAAYDPTALSNNLASTFLAKTNGTATNVIANGTVGMGTNNNNGSTVWIAGDNTHNTMDISAYPGGPSFFTINHSGGVFGGSFVGNFMGASTYNNATNYGQFFPGGIGSANSMTRNQVDGYPALVVQNQNALSTGPIQQWKDWAGNVRAQFDTNGLLDAFGLVGVPGTTLYGTYYPGWSGGNTLINRNTADSYSVLALRNANASSTGPLLQFQDWAANTNAVIMTNGWHGIGTNYAASPLDVAATNATGNAQQWFSTPGGSAKAYMFTGNGNSTLGVNAISSMSGNAYGQMVFGTPSATGYFIRNSADAIAAFAAQNGNASSTGPLMQFKDWAGNVNAVVATNGFFGIGTNAATVAMSIAGTPALPSSHLFELYGRPGQTPCVWADTNGSFLASGTATFNYQAQISRTQPDATSPLTVRNAHASSTGPIATFSDFGNTIRAQINTNGVIQAASTILGQWTVGPGTNNYLPSTNVSVIFGSNNVAAYTVTLPAPVPANAGWQVSVKDKAGTANTFNLTIATGGGLIDGAGNYVINTAKGAATLTSDGTNYFVLSKY